MFKVAADSAGTPALVLKGAAPAMESPDGRFIYYTRGINVPGLWRVPSGGGKPASVIPSSHWYNWTVANGKIYFVEQKSTALKFLDLNSGVVAGVTSLDRILDDLSGLSISPDGRSILYAREDQVTSDIVLVRGFR